MQVLGDEQWADWATLFFCFNPASVFYSAVYTESVFAATTFWGLVLLPRSGLLSTCCFVVAAAARSNGACEPSGGGSLGRWPRGRQGGFGMA